eukprot:TRINITY_DN211_c0_g1_i1.p1 TRINITY_DN211_c0_g1~~TRINITY_DN211_c0_g1_i1.p1  ORF type:complete len:562 (+),score=203.77 TRINITY_DN211_c0_g1_i1:55-1740(+)
MATNKENLINEIDQIINFIEIEISLKKQILEDSFKTEFLNLLIYLNLNEKKEIFKQNLIWQEKILNLLNNFQNYLFEFLFEIDSFRCSLEILTVFHFFKEIIKRNLNGLFLKFINEYSQIVDILDKNDKSLLHYAAAYGNEAICNYLIKESKLNINQKCNKEYSALFYVVYPHFICPRINVYQTEKSRVECAKALLKAGADIGINRDGVVSISTKSGQSIMHLAAGTAQLLMLNMFVEYFKQIHGSYALVNARNPIDLETPLHLAATTYCQVSEENLEYEELISRPMRDIPFNPYFSKHIAILVHCGADIEATNNKNLRPIHLAAVYEMEENIKYLFSRNAESIITENISVAANCLLEKLNPESAPNYSELSYWDLFYKYQERFEWYEGFEKLDEIFRDEIKKGIKILNIGCGSSDIGEKLLLNGYAKEMVNTDYSKIVIDKMNANLQKKNFKNISYLHVDATDLSIFEDNSFDCVVEKGLLDAIVCGVDWQEKWEKILSESRRVLVDNGKFLIICHSGSDQRESQIPKIGWACKMKSILQDLGDGNIAELYCFILQKINN